MRRRKEWSLKQGHVTCSDDLDCAVKVAAKGSQVKNQSVKLMVRAHTDIRTTRTVPRIKVELLLPRVKGVHSYRCRI